MPEDFTKIEPEILGADPKRAIWLENTHKLRIWNRELGIWRYYNVSGPRPVTPMLKNDRGEEYAYEPSAPKVGSGGMQHPHPVGPGPDRYGYYVVAEPDHHAIGELWQAPGNGGIFCKVETPLVAGGYGERWVKVT